MRANRKQPEVQLVQGRGAGECGGHESFSAPVLAKIALIDWTTHQVKGHAYLLETDREQLETRY